MSFPIIKIICVFFCLAWAQASHSQSLKLIKTKIADRLTMGVPEEFSVMPPNAYAKKYGAYRTPLAIYTSPDGKADLGVNQMANRLASNVAQADWKEEDLKILQGMYKASILAMHEKVDFIQDKTEIINKKPFIVFEFVGTVRDEDASGSRTGKELKQYSYIQYAIDGKQVTIFNFTCPNSQIKYYQQLANNVMHSVKFK